MSQCTSVWFSKPLLPRFTNLPRLGMRGGRPCRAQKKNWGFPQHTPEGGRSSGLVMRHVLLGAAGVTRAPGPGKLDAVETPPLGSASGT